MNRKKFYITTAIDYPSGPPHMGHAYEKICADCLARWHRLKGEDVFLLTGTDEHGQKIQRYATRAGQRPQEFVDRMSEKFIQLCQKLNLSNDDFIRTTQGRHTNKVQSLFEKIYEKGDIYKGVYEGLYCIDCESFYLEKDLKQGRCPVHDKPAERIKEESYFFKTSKYQGRVLEHIREKEDFIQPQSRRQEVINRLEEGLRDLSVSRCSFSWGIPPSFDKGHVIFVWFDALMNYITALNYPGEKFRKFWPCDVHLVGKDILWFHAVIWPCILMAAEIELPKSIFVHGFINVGGEKLSKSKGLLVDPMELIQLYGADPLRYFLLREVRFGEDGNFSQKALIGRLNSDLANDLGNLLNRTLTMVEKYFDSLVPEAFAQTDGRLGTNLKSKAHTAIEELISYMEGWDLSGALKVIFELINSANKYIEDSSPWKLAREESGKRALCNFINNLMAILKVIGVLLWPFIPSTAEEIQKRLGIDEGFDRVEFFRKITNKTWKWEAAKAGTKINKGKPLFPRIKT